MTVTINNILCPELTRIVQDIPSKKKLLETLSEIVAETSVNYVAEDIYQRLLKRERQGSTGIGKGVAIPHCRLSACEAPFAVLLKLAQPLDFDAIDRKPVDIVVGLFVPEQEAEEHLQLLSEVAQCINNDEYLKALKCAPSDIQLFNRGIEAPEKKS